MSDVSFNLSDVFGTVARTIPDQTFLVWRDRRLSYADVDARVDGFARYLASVGFGCHTERDSLAGHESGQDHLGIYLRNGNEYLEAMIGSYRARVAPFNASYRYVEEELVYLLTDSKARALVYPAEFASRERGSDYNPFNLLMVSRDEAFVAYNRAGTIEIVELTPGLHLLSNLNVNDFECPKISASYGKFAHLGANAEFQRDPVGYGPFLVPELAEAASRTGDLALVRAALQWLSERTAVTPTDWSLGIEARIRAFLSDGEAAERLYRESIDRLGRTQLRAELARSHLLYGEWLRRERRRGDAREQLRTAYGMLDAMGIGAFAERARRELLATGETARKRTVETTSDLTAQEAQVARLARDGLSNPEIGARLFISPRTVKYHLAKVFTKLDISSRSQLHRALPADPDTARPR